MKNSYKIVAKSNYLKNIIFVCLHTTYNYVYMSNAELIRGKGILVLSRREYDHYFLYSEYIPAPPRLYISIFINLSLLKNLRLSLAQFFHV